MLLGILAFEWRYATRRPTFAAAAAVFLGLGIVLGGTAFGAGDGRIDGPYPVALSAGLLALAGALAAGVICGPALLRDAQHQMVEIVSATAVTPRAFLGGRFLGSFLVLASAYACGIAGLALGTALAGHDPARLGPMTAAPYLRALLFLGLPSLLFVSAVTFAVAALTRSAAATYVAGVAFYVLYFAVALFTGSPLMAGAGPQSDRVAAVSALLDPFGLSAVFHAARHWTVAERDARALSLTGLLLQNRLLWLGLTMACVALSSRVFAFRVAGRTSAGRPADTILETAHAARPAVVGAASVSARGFSWPGFGSCVRLELRFLLRSWPFLSLVVLWVGTAGIEMVQTFRSAEYGTALWPLTGLLVNELTQPLSLFGLLAVAYYAGDVVWRERDLRMAEVVDATPVSSALLLGAKALSLSGMLCVLTTVAIATAVAFQLACGHRPDTPLVFLSLLWFAGWPLLLVGVLALLIQTLAPNRQVGLLLTIAAGLFWHQGALGGPAHPLLRYAAAPVVPYSPMAGFSGQAASFAWFMAFWTAIAAGLMLTAVGLWRRGTAVTLGGRLRALPRTLGSRGRVLLPATVVLAVVTGALVYYQTDVVNGYESEGDAERWAAGYEKTWGHLVREAQPTVAHLDSSLDLYPEARRLRWHGTARLENRTREPVLSVFVVLPRGVAGAAVQVAGRAADRIDARYATHAFDLAVPLLPGGSIAMTFDVHVQRWGARAAARHDILANGTFVRSASVLPQVGYRRSYELVDATARRRQGLPARPEGPDIGDTALEDASALLTFDLRLSTSGDQIPLGPGALEEAWEDAGRRHGRFRSRGPSVPSLAVTSGRYAVERAVHGDTLVEIYHHPAHTRNVAHMQEAARRSLEYCQREFGRYPYPQLRIVELPSYALPAAAFALPGIVFFAEQRGFLTDRRDEGRIDIVTKRVAHEVSHQWWGHQAVPPVGPGASAVVETLARYTELMVLKERYGPAVLPEVLEAERTRYLQGRAADPEVPLASVGREPWLYYAKGALVMAALEARAGERAVNGALRGLLASRATEPPTAAALVRRLEEAVPAPHRPLVDERWRQVVLHDLRLEAATARPLPDGRYAVDLTIAASRRVPGPSGDVSLPFAEAVDVAVHAADDGRQLYAAPHPVAGRTSLSIVVGAAPGRCELDPLLRQIEKDRGDNVRQAALVR